MKGHLFFVCARQGALTRGFKSPVGPVEGTASWTARRASRGVRRKKQKKLAEGMADQFALIGNLKVISGNLTLMNCRDTERYVLCCESR